MDIPQGLHVILPSGKETLLRKLVCWLVDHRYFLVSLIAFSLHRKGRPALELHEPSYA